MGFVVLGIFSLTRHRHRRRRVHDAEPPAHHRRAVPARRHALRAPPHLRARRTSAASGRRRRCSAACSSPRCSRDRPARASPGSSASSSRCSARSSTSRWYAVVADDRRDPRRGVPAVGVPARVHRRARRGERRRSRDIELPRARARSCRCSGCRCSSASTRSRCSTGSSRRVSASIDNVERKTDYQQPGARDGPRAPAEEIADEADETRDRAEKARRRAQCTAKQEATSDRRCRQTPITGALGRLVRDRARASRSFGAAVVIVLVRVAVRHDPRVHDVRRCITAIVGVLARRRASVRAVDVRRSDDGPHHDAVARHGRGRRRSRVFLGVGRARRDAARAAAVGRATCKREELEGARVLRADAAARRPGMLLMTTANDLIVVFLALEILSIPLYVLAAFDRRRLTSQEAGIKYFVLGAFSSAVFLYGVALVYGATGTTSLTGIADVPRAEHAARRRRAARSASRSCSSASASRSRRCRSTCGRPTCTRARRRRSPRSWRRRRRPPRSPRCCACFVGAFAAVPRRLAPDRLGARRALAARRQHRRASCRPT